MDPTLISTGDRTWLKVWLFALAITMLSLCAIELSLRAMGHQPSIVDDVDLWIYHRNQVYGDESKALTLLGDSRMQLGIDTSAMRKRMPDYTITQLAVDSSDPLPTLIDLLNDKEYSGLIICAATESTLYAFGEEPAGIQQDYVDAYRKRWQGSGYLDRRISLWLQDHLVIVNPSVRLEKLFFNLVWKQTLPEPYYLITLPDRSRQADYATTGVKHLRARRIAQAIASQAIPSPSPEKWLHNALKLEPQLLQFRERGGNVVFVYFPISDETLASVTKRFPKAQYWDQFAAKTNALTIHFQDKPALAAFDLPDTSHLDFRDAPSFTNALMDELERLGFFGKPSIRSAGL